jgi:hypothetical protein
MVCGCIGVVFLLVVFFVLLTFTILMVKGEKDEQVHLYTTANESNYVYARSYMQSVCMSSIADDGLNWVLYTGSCYDGVKMLRRFTITDTITGEKGYFLYLLKDSFVNVTFYNGSGGVYFQMETDREKAEEMRHSCLHGEELQPNSTRIFEETGYYYLCAYQKQPQQPIHFQISVAEFYYSKPIGNECNDTVNFGHKCCFRNLVGSGHETCVYITTRNQQVNTNAISEPYEVEVYMKYNRDMKILTYVLMPMAIIIAIVLVVLIMKRCAYMYKARKVANQRPRRP